MFKFQICSKIFFYIAIIIGLVTCNNEDDKLKKTSNFKPKVNNYDFFIEGEIEDKILHYKQINFEWTNVSNKYFSVSEETWLQGFSDSIDFNGSWKIRVHDINIEKIDLPYTLKQSEGSISWFDSRVDLIIQDTDFCQGVDNGCTFMLTPKRGNITITKVKDQIIEGSFNGRAIILRTGMTPGQDENLFHEIENGKFRIKYRME